MQVVYTLPLYRQEQRHYDSVIYELKFHEIELLLISLFYLSNINQSIAKIDTSPIQV